LSHVRRLFAIAADERPHLRPGDPMHPHRAVRGNHFVVAVITVGSRALGTAEIPRALPDNTRADCLKSGKT
jgi:hypothetical protein